MRLYKFILPVALFAALALGATPVEAPAQHGGGRSHGGAGFQNHSEFHGRGEFHGDHFRHGFGPGFRFRPRFAVGFGVFLGNPFGYPFYDPWNYWAYPVGPLTYVPGRGDGGVSFSISPADASLNVMVPTPAL